MSRSEGGVSRVESQGSTVEGGVLRVESRGVRVRLYGGRSRVER